MAKAAFDLDAAAAARREAAGEPFTFTYGGQKFTCLPAKEWPIAVAGMLGTDMPEAVKLILGGGKQADLFMSLNPTLGDVEDLLSALSQWSGIGDLGE
jgi:hypothetical protein